MNPSIVWPLLKKPNWLQILTRRKASWSSHSEIEDWKSNVPKVQDDGMHYNKTPFYFEWWYFDIIYGEGESLSVIFHITDLIMPQSDHGSINISVMEKGKTLYQKLTPYPRHEIKASIDECNVSIGKNRCFVEEGGYRIEVDESDMKCNLTLQADAISWRPGTGKFDFGKDKYFAWVVPQPKATVTGKVVIRGEEKIIEGEGYHDHNWGTVSLLNTVNEWSWGRVYLSDNYAFVFVDIKLSAQYGGYRVMPCALIRKNEVLLSSFLQCNTPINQESDFFRDPKTVDWPEGWRLNAKNADYEFTLNLTTKYVLEKSDMLSGGYFKRKMIELCVAHPYYVRCFVSAQGEIETKTFAKNIVGKGIYEQITFGRG